MAKITHVMVGYECTHCKGEGKVPGGSYLSQGEFVACPLCLGLKLLSKWITLQEFSQLFIVDVDFTFRPVREERSSNG